MNATLPIFPFPVAIARSLARGGFLGLHLVLGVGLGFLAAFQAPAAALESGRVVFRVDDATGAWELTDSRTGVAWTSHPGQPRFAEATVSGAGPARTIPLHPAAIVQHRDRLELEFHPLPELPAAALRIRVTLERRSDTLEFLADADPALKLGGLRLLDQALGQSESDAGYVVVPTREGLLIPGDSGMAFTHRFDTYAYEGCHFRMFGVVKRGAAALVTWTDPYVALELRSSVTNAPATVAGARPTQSLTTSLLLRQSARGFRLRLLGPGDYGTLAHAYREVARDQGFVVTWDRKIRENPDRAKYLGASNYKLWSALDRQMDDTSTKEQRVRVNWTFDEAAQVAEHLRSDLRLDRVLFHMGGWIHRGYDNQHPDILPAAPECGGDAALADCARRVHALGYLFCLHDNYQDIYRDAPSWDEKWINKNPDGSLTVGGAWAGGRAYITCSQMALELARRPGNLAAVRQLTGVRSYFIDTTYAAGLFECHDPSHPMTRADDLKWKIALSDYARSVFGSFGSECGREWAIPHSDFFEGLAGVSGQGFHDTGLQKKLGASIIPFFEMVYRDCIAVYGKYGYDPAHAADYVLHHVALGRPLHYHNIPPHRYWRDPAANDVLSLVPAVTSFEASSPREFRIAYRWAVGATPPGAPWRVFVHFVDPAGKIVFQNDHPTPSPVAEWQPGTVDAGPFTVRVPENAAGSFDVVMGLFDPATGRRARLTAPEGDEHTYAVGTLRIEAGGLRFQAASTTEARPGRPPGIFQRGDGGWTAGLHPYDRFVKNTHEILSPLHELTARVLLERHEFLDPQRRVQRSVFGSGRGAFETVVNGGDAPLRRPSHLGGTVELPPGGFLVEGPEFVAFLATEWSGRRFSEPTLFTLRAADGRSLDRARRIRIYHGFGDPHLALRGREFNVPREDVLAP